MDHNENKAFPEWMSVWFPNFDLASWDRWFAGLYECGAKHELILERTALYQAFLADDHERMRDKLKIMVMRRAMIEAKPVAVTGKRVRKPFASANAQRRDQSRAEGDDWQLAAAAKWAEPQHANKSATEIAKLIAPGNWNTVRRKIRKLS